MCLWERAGYWERWAAEYRGRSQHELHDRLCQIPGEADECKLGSLGHRSGWLCRCQLLVPLLQASKERRVVVRRLPLKVEWKQRFRKQPPPDSPRASCRGKSGRATRTRKNERRGGGG